MEPPQLLYTVTVALEGRKSGQVQNSSFGVSPNHNDDDRRKNTYLTQVQQTYFSLRLFKTKELYTLNLLRHNTVRPALTAPHMYKHFLGYKANIRAYSIRLKELRKVDN